MRAQLGGFGRKRPSAQRRAQSPSSLSDAHLLTQSGDWKPAPNDCHYNVARWSTGTRIAQLSLGGWSCISITSAGFEAIAVTLPVLQSVALLNPSQRGAVSTLRCSIGPSSVSLPLGPRTST